MMNRPIHNCRLNQTSEAYQLYDYVLCLIMWIAKEKKIMLCVMLCFVPCFLYLTDYIG
jgi:hypothetical protein